MTLNGRICVIGIGSPIMTDDSIGLRVSKAIEDKCLEDVDCHQEAVGGIELLPLLRGYSYVVVVDAIQSREYGPGTVLIYDTEDFEEAVTGQVPAHDINIPTALKIGRKMDPDTMPLSVKFVAVEIEDMQTMSEDLTPPVRAALPSAESAVMHLIDQFRRDRNSREQGS